MNPKQLAAEKAAEFVQDGMLVGLGTGSTAYWAIRKLGERVRNGLSIRAVPSSAATEAQALEIGIPLASFAEIDRLDIYIDGADEVDASKNLIKGGGGALLREKILAYNSKAFYVIVDESKYSQHLNRAAIPVEVLPFAHELAVKNLKALGCLPVIRRNDQQVFITENGNYIVDCRFNIISNPESLEAMIRAIPGVMECGLFPGKRVTHVIVGHADGEIRIF